MILALEVSWLDSFIKMVLMINIHKDKINIHKYKIIGQAQILEGKVIDSEYSIRIYSV